MIRVLVVDDHPAVRAGLVALLSRESGLAVLGVAAHEDDMWVAIRRDRPDVVVLDHKLPGANGLVLCRRLASVLPPPKVVLYSAFAARGLAPLAWLAGARALVDKSAEPRELLYAVHAVARGERLVPPPTPLQLEAVAGGLGPEDSPLIGMLLGDTPRAEMAEVLRLTPTALERRLDALFARLGAADRAAA